MSTQPSEPRAPDALSWLEAGLLVVVAVVFAALLMPLAEERTEPAGLKRARDEVRRLARAASRMAEDTQSQSAACFEPAVLERPPHDAPAECGAPAACDARETVPGTPCWGGPYLAPAPPRDPWGRPYRIGLDADGIVRARSAGPDGATGTGDDLVSPE